MEGKRAKRVKSKSTWPGEACSILADEFVKGKEWGTSGRRRWTTRGGLRGENRIIGILKRKP